MMKFAILAALLAMAATHAADTTSDDIVEEIDTSAEAAEDTFVEASATEDEGARESCNWMCYMERYPDLQTAFNFGKPGACAKAQDHYNKWGKNEGRDCSCPADAKMKLECVEQVGCTTGRSVSRTYCDSQMVKDLDHRIIKRVQNYRGRQGGSAPQLVVGYWDHVPPGCSVQTGGDWVSGPSSAKSSANVS